MKRLALAAATALLLAGCGDAEPTTTAADAVPSLANRLEKVDGLLADRRWAAARTELRGIVTTANDARAAGDLDELAADRVVASAQRLLAALPSPTPTSTPTPTPTATVHVPPADGGGPGGEGKGNGKKAEEAAKKAEEAAKKAEEAAKKAEEEAKKREEQRKKEK